MAVSRKLTWTAAVVVGLVVALGASGSRLGRWVVEDPQWRVWATEWVLEGSGVTLRMGAVDVDPSSWRVQLEDVRVESPRGRIAAARVSAAVPGLWSALVLGRVELGRVELDAPEVVGVRGGAHAARRRPWRTTLVIDQLHIRDAHFVLPELPSARQPRVELSGLAAELSRVRVRLGQGMVRGGGRLSMERLSSGRLRATQVEVGELSVEGDTIHLRDGRFAVSGGAGAGAVAIEQRPGGPPRLLAELEVKQVRLERMVELATGEASPITGRLAGEVEVAIGHVPDQRGAVTRIDARLEDGALTLGAGMSPVLKRALKVAPFLNVQGGQVRLGPTTAKLELRPGRVEIEQLVHESAGRDLAARGQLVGQELELVVRLVPRRRAAERAGFGIVVTGSAGALAVRRATADELSQVGP